MHLSNMKRPRWPTRCTHLLAMAQAIGARNIVDSEPETRRRKQRELQALIDEKIAEHDRSVAHFHFVVAQWAPDTLLPQIDG